MKPEARVFSGPLGFMGFISSEAGVRRVILPLPSRREVISRIRERWAGPIGRGPGETGRAILQALEGRSTRIPVDLSGVSPFGRGVLEAVSGIPRGTTITYGGIAEMVGRPGAARAVGGALRRNPVPILIPCHRVVSRCGPGGFTGGGIDIKIRLIEMEKAG